jgi:Protein tyrosine and serine/threonine kinase
MCSRRRPYDDIETREEVISQVQAGLRLPKPDSSAQPAVSASAYVMDQLYDLMTRCWDANPSQRPVFQSITETLGQLIALPDETLNVDLPRPAVYTDYEPLALGSRSGDGDYYSVSFDAGRSEYSSL